MTWRATTARMGLSLSCFVSAVSAVWALSLRCVLTGNSARVLEQFQNRVDPGFGPRRRFLNRAVALAF
jgi:hypothetical protein